MVQMTAYRYIVTDELILGGEPIIKGTRMPVRAVVELWRQGVSLELIPTHLSHLTLAHISDALRYYNENQEQINGYIESNRIPEELLDPLVKFLEQRELLRACTRLKIL